MAWLIRERRKAKGHIERLEKALDALPEKIAAAKADLAVLDAVIPRPEVEVEPSSIDSVREYKTRVVPYGKMTKHILECLRLSDGNPRYATEIALFVCRACDIDLKEVSKTYVSERVSRRLKSLTANGIEQRHHPSEAEANVEGQWSLLPDA